MKTNPRSQNRNLKPSRSLKSAASVLRSRSVVTCNGSPPLPGGAPLPHLGQGARGLAQSKTWRRTLALCLLFFALCPPVSAQYSIDWHTIDGGGGTSTGGVYSVSGTIGQPDAGPPAHGGGYILQSGFWSVIAVVQTPGAPFLTIARTTTNTVVVSWPLPAEGWVLQATNTLPNVATTWPVIPPPYQTNGPNLQSIEPAPAGNKLYRLHKP